MTIRNDSDIRNIGKYPRDEYPVNTADLDVIELINPHHVVTRNHVTKVTERKHDSSRNHVTKLIESKHDSSRKHVTKVTERKHDSSRNHVTKVIERKHDSSRNKVDIRCSEDTGCSGYTTNRDDKQLNENNSHKRYAGHSSKQSYSNRQHINDKKREEDCYNSKEVNDLKKKSASYKIKIEHNSKTGFEDKSLNTLNVISYDNINTVKANSRSQNISTSHSEYLPHEYNNFVGNEIGQNMGYKYNIDQCNDRFTNSKIMKLKESNASSEKYVHKNIKKCMFDNYYLPIKYRKVDTYSCINTATYLKNLKEAYLKYNGTEPSNNGSLIDMFYNEKKCTLNNVVNIKESKSSKEKHVTINTLIDNNNNVDNYKDHDDSDDYLTAEDRSELSNRLLKY